MMRRVIGTIFFFFSINFSSYSYSGYLDTGIVDDWTGKDALCARGAEPTHTFCDTGAMDPGTVAVCWDNITTFNPRGQPTDLPNDESRRCPTGTMQWCVYKNVKISIVDEPNAPKRIDGPPRDGRNPGKVYICQP